MFITFVDRQEQCHESGDLAGSLDRFRLAEREAAQVADLGGDCCKLGRVRTCHAPTLRRRAAHVAMAGMKRHERG
jgi:hypothetical protein